MSNKRNIPKLRFIEFKKAPAWQEKKLVEISLFLKDGTHATHPNDEKSDYKLLSAKNINNNSIKFFEDDRSISQSEYDSIYKNYKLEKNDILLTIVGTIGRTALYKREENIAFQRSVAFIRTSESQYFINHVLNTNKIKNQLDKLTSISAQPGVYLSDLKNLRFTLPKSNEQKKIANFLSNLDKRIEKQQELIEKYKELKKGYLQKLFPKKGKNIPELRFNEFIKYEEWNPTIIDKLINESNTKTKENNQHNILSSTKKGLFLQSDYFDKQVASQNNIGYKIVTRDQFILSPQNAWMGNYNINDSYDIGIVSPSYKVFNVHNHVVYPLFFKNFIRTTIFNRIIESNSEAGASIVRRNLNIDNLLKEEVYTPSIEEQVLIGEFLEKISITSAIMEDLQTNNIKEKQYFLNNVLV